MRRLPEGYLNDAAWVNVEGREVTPAGARLLRQHQIDLGYVTVDRQVVEVLRERAERFDAILRTINRNATPLAKVLSLDHDVKALIASADRVRGEVVLTRYIDSYLSYVADLLREILLARPEALRTSEKLTFEEAIAFSTMEELTAFVADRTVTRLSFKSLDEISAYFANRLGMPLVSDEALRSLLTEWVALRNLITHRRGVVDQRALVQGLPSGDDYPLGERVQVTPARGFDTMAGVVLAALELDQRAAEKFALATTPFENDPYSPSLESFDVQPYAAQGVIRKSPGAAETG